MIEKEFIGGWTPVKLVLPHGLADYENNEELIDAIGWLDYLDRKLSGETVEVRIARLSDDAVAPLIARCAGVWHGHQPVRSVQDADVLLRGFLYPQLAPLDWDFADVVVLIAIIEEDGVSTMKIDVTNPKELMVGEEIELSSTSSDWWSDLDDLPVGASCFPGAQATA